MRRGRRIALAAFVAVVLSAAVAPVAFGAERQQPASQGRVVSSLELDADRSGWFEVATATSVRVPADSELSTRARREARIDPGGDFFGDRRRLLSSGLGLYAPGELFLAGVRVEGGAVVASSGLSGQDAYEAPGLFAVRIEDGLTVRTLRPRSAAGVALTVRIELDEIEVEAVDPRPTSLTRSGSETRLEWRFGPGEAAAISVDGDLPWAVELNADLAREGWGGLWVIAWLVLVLAFLPVLYVLLGHRRALGDGETAARLRGQAGWLCLAGGFVLLAAVAELIDTQNLLHGWTDSSDWGRIGLEALSLPFFAAAAGAIAIGARPAEWRRVVNWCAAAAAALALVVVSASHGPLSYELHDVLEYPAFAAASAAWVLVVFLAVEGLARIAVGWLGGVERWQRPVAVGSALFVVLLGWSAATVQGDVFNQAAFAIPASLREVVYALAPLLPLAVLPGVFALLALVARSRPLAGGGRGPQLLVSALFAFFVVTAAGAFVGFPSPFSLLLGGLVLAALVWVGAPARPAGRGLDLGRGPGADWAENGRIALRVGALLAVVPVAYVVVAILRFNLGWIADPVVGTELLVVLWVLGGELALWLSAALVFGLLFSWLPTGNGVLKGFLLSLPVFAGLGLMQLCPLYSGSPDWWFRCAEVLVFLSVLGLAMDLRTARASGRSGREVAALYRSRRLGYGLAVAVPLLVAAFCVYQQFGAGDPQDAVRVTLEALPGQLPGSE